MGRSIPVNLGNSYFRSKTEAREFFQQMLKRYNPGDRVKKSDAVLLDELIKRHPDAKTKIGPGVHHFEVGGADFGSQCFYIYRIDGTYEDFSLHSCVDQY
jgi:hypothetical protein